MLGRRGFALLAVLAAACSSEQRFTMSIPDGAEVVVLLSALDSGPTRGTVATRASLAASPIVLDVPDGVALNAELIAYTSDLELLGLTVGTLEATTGEGRSLPDDATHYESHLVGGDSSVTAWAPASGPGPLAAGFRFAGSCPPAAAGSAPIELVEGCPLPFPERPTSCYAPRELVTALDGDHSYDVGSIVVEDARTWLYLSSSRFGSEQYSRHGRAQLLASRQAEAATVMALETIPAPAKVGTEWVHRGFAGRPWVRADGLEMVFTSSYPDADDFDQEGSLSVRPNTQEPWPAGEYITIFGNPLSMTDGTHSPVILRDWRTVLWAHRSGALRYGWRSERAQADISARGAVFREDGGPIVDSIATTCEGGHVLIVESGRPLIAKITSMPRRGADGPVGDLALEPRAFTELGWPANTWMSTMTEAPDCGAIYVSDGRRVYVLVRVTC